MFTLRCLRCNFLAGVEERGLTCPLCHGQLVIEYDYDAIAEKAREVFDGHVTGMWKYLPLLPLADMRNIVTMGEGGTRVVRAANLGRYLGLSQLLLKIEAWNPTGSHKDRQISLATSRALELRYQLALTSSSGNVGAAVAAYTSRAGIKSVIMVPNVIPEEKMIQISAYGGFVVVVDTPDNVEVANLVEKLVKEFGAYDMVTAAPHNPYTLEAGRTIAFEIFEQIKPLPDIIVTPVGGGGLLGSLWKGFTDLVKLGFVDEKEIPRLVGVQAEGCQPFVRAVRERWPLEKVLNTPWEQIRTICTALADTIPLDAMAAIPAVKETGGTAIAVSDAETLEAGKLLSSMEGIFAEPSSNVCIAAIRRLVEAGWIKSSDRVLSLVTGTGLKDLRSIRAVISPPTKIRPSLGEAVSIIRQFI
ncbi:Threonine synthase [archaeon HR01]|nr:Threonine synthase [archaeon HR01]